MTIDQAQTDTPLGPVLFAYDGSDLAGLAIEQAGRELTTGRDALVLCVWQPASVGFNPINGRQFDADCATDVYAAALETAQYGASLATNLGFKAKAVTVEQSPTWKAIVTTAQDRKASLIVVGSHRHQGIVGHIAGSVAAAVISHATSPVFIVHPPAPSA